MSKYYIVECDNKIIFFLIYSMNNLIKKILTEVRGVLDHQDEGHKSKLC